MMLEVEPLQYGVLWKPMRFDNEVLVGGNNENNNSDRYQNQHNSSNNYDSSNSGRNNRNNNNNNNFVEPSNLESPKCKHCGSTNHFSRNCRSKPVTR